MTPRAPTPPHLYSSRYSQPRSGPTSIFTPSTRPSTPSPPTRAQPPSPGEVPPSGPREVPGPRPGDAPQPGSVPPDKATSWVPNGAAPPASPLLASAKMKGVTDAMEELQRRRDAREEQQYRELAELSRELEAVAGDEGFRAAKALAVRKVGRTAMAAAELRGKLLEAGHSERVADLVVRSLQAEVRTEDLCCSRCGAGCRQNEPDTVAGIQGKQTGCGEAGQGERQGLVLCCAATGVEGDGRVAAGVCDCVMEVADLGVRSASKGKEQTRVLLSRV